MRTSAMESTGNTLDTVSLVTTVAEAISNAIEDYRSFVPAAEKFANECNLVKDGIKTWCERTPDLNTVAVDFMHQCSQDLAAGKDISGLEFRFVVPDVEHTASIRSMLKCLRVIYEGLFEARRLKKKIAKKRKSRCYKLWKLSCSGKLRHSFEEYNEALVAARKQYNDAVKANKVAYQLEEHTDLDYQLKLLKRGGHTEAIKFWNSQRGRKEVAWTQFWSDYRTTYLNDSSVDDIEMYEEHLRDKFVDDGMTVLIGVFRAFVVNELGFPFDFSKLHTSVSEKAKKAVAHQTVTGMTPVATFDTINTLGSYGPLKVKTKYDYPKLKDVFKKNGRTDQIKDFQQYLNLKGCEDLFSPLSRAGVTSKVDASDKSVADFVAMGLSLDRAQYAYSKLSNRETPVGKRLVNAGFSDFCKTFFVNEYYAVEDVNIDFRHLYIMGADKDHILPLLDLFSGTEKHKKYAVFVSCKYQEVGPATTKLFEWLYPRFDKHSFERIFYNPGLPINRNDLKRHIQNSNAMLIVLSKSYVYSKRWMFEAIYARQLGIHCVACILDSGLDRDVFTDLGELLRRMPNDESEDYGQYVDAASVGELLRFLCSTRIFSFHSKGSLGEQIRQARLIEEALKGNSDMQPLSKDNGLSRDLTKFLWSKQGEELIPFLSSGGITDLKSTIGKSVEDYCKLGIPVKYAFVLAEELQLLHANMKLKPAPVPVTYVDTVLPLPPVAVKASPAIASFSPKPTIEGMDAEVELETYFRKKGWLDLLPKLTVNGVTSLQDLEYKVEEDYLAMGISLKSAKVLTNELSFLKTPVSKKLKAAGFGDDYCRKLYYEGYYAIEDAASDLDEDCLVKIGIPNEDCEKMLKLFRKYAVYISHSYTPARGAASWLYDRLEVGFKNDPIYYDFHVLQDTAQLREHIKYSKAILILLSKEYFKNAYCILEIVEAFEANIPMCPCVVDNDFTRDVFAYTTKVWKNLEPVEQYTGEEFLRQAGIRLDKFKLVMQVLQKRKCVEFKVGINPHVQKGQFLSIVEALEECHKEKDKGANPLAKT